MGQTSLENRVTLKMLRYFLAVAEELHFGRAAQRLNISQPPLSVQIKELEAILETSLFERHTRSVVLTKPGELLKAECYKIFNTVSTSLNLVAQSGRQANAGLKIGIISTALWEGFLSRVSVFKSRFPEVDIKFVEMPPSKQKSVLAKGGVDLGISRFADGQNIAPLNFTGVTRENMCVALSSEHPLAGQKRVSLKALAKEPFAVMSRDNSASTELVISECLGAGFYPSLVYEVNEPQTMMGFVAANQAISVVPESFRQTNGKQIHFVDLEETIRADLVAMYDPKNRNETLRYFIQFLAETGS